MTVDLTDSYLQIDRKKPFNVVKRTDKLSFQMRDYRQSHLLIKTT